MRTINYRSFGGDFEATVKIDDNEKTMGYLKEQVLFWADGESRLSAHDGNVFNAYVEMLGEELIAVQAEYGGGLCAGGVMDAFASREGWAPLTGEYGVLITHCDYEHPEVSWTESEDTEAA